MNLKTIREVNFDNKRVLVRADFNVSVDIDGNIMDTYKLESIVKTVDYILSFSNVKLALISHRGRPSNKDDEKFSMTYLIDDLQRILDIKVKFVSDCIGKKISNELNIVEDDEVILLENVRFYKEEKKNNKDFAKKLSEPFDIYINDAFSVSHREHASICEITKYLPSYAGIRLLEEISVLEEAKKASNHPAIAIIGGAKIETKLPLIKKFEESYDKILVGGRISIEAEDTKIEFSDKVVLPVDYALNKFDIGEKTIEEFVNYIKDAKTIIWNGPLGKFEEKPFDKGTIAIANAIAANKEAFSVVGGGESIQSLNQTENFDKISFVSTGGGAMLSFLSSQDMPGLEVLAK